MAVASLSPTLQLTMTVRHGFPDDPSCMAYDCVQDVLAFGSQNGEVIVFGRPGLEIRFKAPCAVLKLQFSINKGVIAVYCSDQTCYFWSIQTNVPKLLGAFKLPGKENLTVLYWPYNSNTVYIGTSSGNVLFVVIELTEMHGIAVNANILICEDTIYWNKVTVPSHGFRRDHPGKIVSVEEHPLEPDKVLIAFEQGLCIIWNLRKKEVEYRHQHTNLEYASWNGGSGKEYTFCSTEAQIVGVTLKKKEEKMLYQCQGIGSITNLQTYNIKQNKWILFVKCYVSDGMSRTEVIVLGEKNVLCSLSFDQPVIDILCIPSTPFKAERQTPKALVVLQQRKLDVLDLQVDLSHQSPVPFNIPFSFNTLFSVGFLHNGGHCLSQSTVDKLTLLKAKFASQGFYQGLSSNPWPFQGGKVGSRDISDDSFPVLLVTSACDKADSITLWLSFSDILENLFTINTAMVFPLNYTNPQDLSGSFDTTTDTVSQGAVDSDKQLDVKFLSVNMMDETLVFVNHRGNVLIYKFSQLQPAYEIANSIEILLNEVEQVDSTNDISSQLPWRFWPGKETNQIHLLHHVCCVLNWEDSVQLVPIESTVYNDKISTLILGTHIAMVVVDLKNKGTIVIDTLKTLKLSRCLSSNSNNQRRIVVESKTKSGVLKRIGGNKKDKKSQLHESTPFKSSFVETVFFTTNMREQPSLTVWMGTESGELVVYKLLRNPLNDKEVQMISTNVILHQKDPIMELIFMTEKYKEIDSNVKWHCSLLDSKQLVDQDNLTVCNYVIVQTKQKIESFGFPSKKVTPIGKFNGTRNNVAKSFLTRLDGAQYLLLLLSHGELQLCSLPALNAITSFHITPDIQSMNMLSFTTNGQGVYVVNSSEIQKVTAELLKENEPDGPVDSTNCQSTFLPLTGPLKPADKQYHLISKKIVSHDKCDRQSWFTPKQKTFISSRTRDLSKSMPSHYSSKTKSTGATQTNSTASPYERTVQALDERGERLNNVVETTSKLLQLAEMYADNAQK